jgi:hypothetical protein
MSGFGNLHNVAHTFLQKKLQDTDDQEISDGKSEVQEFDQLLHQAYDRACQAFAFFGVKQAPSECKQ